MAHNPITLDLLRTLQAIEGEGSFAAAAKKLHKVPSSLTYTIQKVETDLDLKLFDRSGHRAIITDAGKFILNQGKQILVNIDDLALNAKQVASGWEPVFNLVYDTVIDIAELLQVVKEFQAVAPFVSVNLMEESLRGTWETLINGTADLIISTDLSAPGDHLFQTSTLSKFEMVLAVAPDHPLVAGCVKIKAAELAKHTVVVIHDTSINDERISTGLANNSRQFVVPNMTDKIKAQEAGLGIGFLPHWRIRQHLKDGTLVELNTESKGESVSLNLAWRNGNNGKALNWFINRLQQVFKEIIMPDNASRC